MLSTELALKANMEYVHVIMDVSAGIKAYHLMWNYPERWKLIIIHLDDFHIFIAFFSVIGKFISGSDFEEIVYQSNLCTSRSLNAALSGKHCTQCWWVWWWWQGQRLVVTLPSGFVCLALLFFVYFDIPLLCSQGNTPWSSLL